MFLNRGTLFYLATDSWDESGKMSVKRYRPSCDNSARHGLVVSGGLHSYVDTIEYTSDGAAFDHLMNVTAEWTNGTGWQFNRIFWPPKSWP